MVEWSIVEYDRPRRVTMRAHSEIVDLQHGIVCVPAEGGTRVTQRSVATFSGRWALLGPALRLLLAYHFRRNDRALKLYLETRHDEVSRLANILPYDRSDWPITRRLAEAMAGGSAMERYAEPRSANTSLRNAMEPYAAPRPVEEPPQVAFAVAAPPFMAEETPRGVSGRPAAKREARPKLDDFLPEPAVPMGGATRSRAAGRRPRSA
jgi:hypothetical protein